MSGGLSVELINKRIEDVEQQIENKEQKAEGLETKIAECEKKLLKAKDAEKAEIEVDKKLAEQQLKKAEAELERLKAKEKEYRDGLREVALTKQATPVAGHSGEAQGLVEAVQQSNRVVLSLVSAVQQSIQRERGFDVPKRRRLASGIASHSSQPVDESVAASEVSASKHPHLYSFIRTRTFKAETVLAQPIEATNWAPANPSTFDGFFVPNSFLKAATVESGEVGTMWNMPQTYKVFNGGTPLRITVRSARPDWIVVHQATPTNVSPATVLQDPAILVEVQSGNKPYEDGVFQLSLSLMAALKHVGTGCLAGLYVRYDYKKKIFGRVTLLCIKQEPGREPEITVNGTYKPQYIPALCLRVFGLTEEENDAPAGITTTQSEVAEEEESSDED